MKNQDLVNKFVEAFSKHVKEVPEGFYDTFEYTKTRNNFTHPRTLGFITKSLFNIGIEIVDIDSRLNFGKIKFQPDIICRDSNTEIVLIIDYESPNSSDARIIEKDVNDYLKWCGVDNKTSTPYIIITTLPDKENKKWELRWASKGDYNHAHRGKREEIRKNPYKYWSDFYKKRLESESYKNKVNNMKILNIDGKKIRFD